VFKGASEYVDDFVARIDAPMLDDFAITFFHQSIFDTPNLPQFVSRTPNLKAHDHKARLVLSDSGVRLAPTGLYAGGFQVELEVPCSRPDWLSSFAQVSRSSFPHTFVSSLENLYIREGELPPSREVDVENGQWLELLHPFTAVKNLYLSGEMTARIAPVLQEFVGERVVEILPALQGLFLEEVTAGPVQEAIEQFAAARQLFGHPIAVSQR
jgi:hypothetical protein